MNNESDSQTLFAQSEIGTPPPQQVGAIDPLIQKKKSPLPLVLLGCVVVLFVVLGVGILLSNTNGNKVARTPIETATPVPTSSALTDLQQRILDLEPTITQADPFTNPFSFPPVDTKTRFLEPKK